MLDLDALAQEIRRVDGNHDLGAGALAETLMPFLSRALQAVGPEPAVAVKPLAWKERADIPGLTNAESHIGWWFNIRAMDGGFEYEGDPAKREDKPKLFATIEAAKAAAQADYASRIRSALVATPPAEPVVEAISGKQVDAALEKLEEIRNLKLTRSVMLQVLRAALATKPAVKDDETVVETLREALKFVNEASGVALGIAVSGSGHPNPDGVLMDLSRKGMGIASRISAALAAKPADKDDGAVVERSYSLKWTDAPRPPVNPRPIKKQASFPTFDDAVAFMAGRAPDSEFRSLTEYATVYEKFDRTADARAALAAKDGRS